MVGKVAKVQTVAVMRDIAIVSHAAIREPVAARDEAELVHAVVAETLASAGMSKDRIGFVCSGSSDLLIGRPFSFVQALDGIAAWPPIRESHVEMDGAWALYEAWLRLSLGDIDVAVVYAFGRPSAGDLKRVLGLQLDPYVLAPLGIDAQVLAGLQRSAMDASGLYDDGLTGQLTPIHDGASAVLLVAGEQARDHAEIPAWIAAMDHRVEPHSPGARDLSRSLCTELAAQHAKVGASGVDWVCLSPAYHDHVNLVKGALLQAGLSVDATIETVPHVPMSAGLDAIGLAAQRLADTAGIDYSYGRVVAVAGSGPALQQSLVCVLQRNMAGLS